jgi:hypothetical protein
MNNNTNLFIISSPFQLLSAIEAKNHFNDATSNLLIFYSTKKRNNEQIDNLLPLSNWNRIVRLKSSFFPHLLYIMKLLFLKKMQRTKNGYDKIFVGDFREEIIQLCLCNLIHNDQYLLDDGTATIELQSNLLFKHIDYFEIIPTKQKTLKKVIKRLCNFNQDYSNEINLFTCFNLKPHNHQTIVNHEFAALRKLAHNSVKTCSDDIYFLGGDYIEAEYVSEIYYFNRLTKIKQYYANNNVIYIPHRGEDDRTLRKIEQIDGFKVERFSNIVEAEFVFRNIYPRTIASFCSTALYTLSIIFQDAQIHSFSIPQTNINPIYRKRMKEFYDFYKKSENIKVIDFDR